MWPMYLWPACFTGELPPDKLRPCVVGLPNATVNQDVFLSKFLSLFSTFGTQNSKLSVVHVID